jgi:branched-chain amino acid transport system permease protein
MLGTWEPLFIMIGIHGMMAWSFYLPESAGVLCCGQPGFIAVGAYTAAIAARTGLPFGLGVLLACIVSIIVAFVIGVLSLRLRGLGIIIVTIGFSMMTILLLENFEFVGGIRGMIGIPFRTNIITVYGCILLLAIFFSRLSRSKLGRAIKAMREDELAAEAIGVDLISVRLFVVAGSGFIAGLVGALWAHYITFIEPAQFGFAMLVLILIYNVVGGGSIYLGPFFGAVAIDLILEPLRVLGQVRLLVYGVLIVVMLMYRPQGLVTRGGVEAAGRILSRSYRALRGGVREGRAEI